MAGRTAIAPAQRKVHDRVVTVPDDFVDAADAEGMRLQFLDAVIVALEHMHELVDLVAACATAEQAQAAVAVRFGLTREGASAVANLQVRRLTADDRRRIVAEREAVAASLNAAGRSSPEP